MFQLCSISNSPEDLSPNTDLVPCYLGLRLGAHADPSASLRDQCVLVEACYSLGRDL